MFQLKGHLLATERVGMEDGRRLRTGLSGSRSVDLPAEHVSIRFGMVWLSMSAT